MTSNGRLRLLLGDAAGTLASTWLDTTMLVFPLFLNLLETSHRLPFVACCHIAPNRRGGARPTRIMRLK
eukprot:779334-Pleurochrysis_carterae.AAC.1